MKLNYTKKFDSVIRARLWIKKMRKRHSITSHGIGISNEENGIILKEPIIRAFVWGFSGKNARTIQREKYLAKKQHSESKIKNRLSLR